MTFKTISEFGSLESPFIKACSEWATNCFAGRTTPLSTSATSNEGVDPSFSAISADDEKIHPPLSMIPGLENAVLIAQSRFRGQQVRKAFLPRDLYKDYGLQCIRALTESRKKTQRLYGGNTLEERVTSFSRHLETKKKGKEEAIIEMPQAPNGKTAVYL